MSDPLLGELRAAAEFVRPQPKATLARPLARALVEPGGRPLALDWRLRTALGPAGLLTSGGGGAPAAGPSGLLGRGVRGLMRGARALGRTANAVARAIVEEADADSEAGDRERPESALFVPSQVDS
jgi:hypothetical protein